MAQIYSFLSTEIQLFGFFSSDIYNKSKVQSLSIAPLLGF